MHHKNEVRNAISVYGFRLHVRAWESKRHGSFVNNDTQRAVTYAYGAVNSATAGAAEVCGLRIADAHPQ